MRLRRQVHHVGDAVLLDHAQHRGLVAQVHVFEHVLRMFLHALKIGRMARIGQAIQIDEPCDLRLVNDVLNQV